MKPPNLRAHRPGAPWKWAVRLAALAAPAALFAATQSLAPSVAPRWQPLELTLQSARNYTDPLRDATLTVQFTSATGERTTALGFWDGGRTWRVRFAPGQLGKWTFRTACSDATNRGLHNLSGAFLCTPPIGTNRFSQHGPVGVARSGRHFAHADHTPFFWLVDAVWEGAFCAQLRDWETYARKRAAQHFTAAQWIALPGPDPLGEYAFRDAGRRQLNLEYFRRLDARIEALDRAGLLSVIAPVWEIESFGAAANRWSANETAALLRYLAARWGANNVAWLLAFEGDAAGQRLKRWKQIGRAVFTDRPGALVMLFPGETFWVLDEFRGEAWVDAFGCQTGPELTEDRLQWMLAGPYAQEWRKEPARPFINLLPMIEDQPHAQAQSSNAADLVRKVSWWSLLRTAPAGVGYAARGLLDWPPVTAPPGKRRHLPAEWERALDFPGAQQMTKLAEFVERTDVWRLRPADHVLASQPGRAAPRRYVAAAGTPANDLLLVYVPEDRVVEVSQAALPPSPVVRWLNPRTGETNAAAAAVVTGGTCRFSTPAPGDWLLEVRARLKIGD